MALFFNGQLLISPAVASRVDDSQMFNPNPGVGNTLAILGPADAGQPKTPLRFGSAAEAAKELRGGELLDAIIRAFNGTLETAGASVIIGVRTQPAVQATLALNNNAAQPVINLAASVWGAIGNRIQVTVANGTTRGKRVRTKLDGAIYEADNIGRQLLSVQYTGAQASADVTVTGTTVVLAAPTGSPVATIQLSDTPTIADLAERISLVTGWTASVLDGNGTHGTAALLDFATAQAAKASPFVITADLQAIVDWINSTAEEVVTATRVANAGTLPVNVSGVYLSGGTTSAAQVGDWSDAFVALQQADVQLVVPASGDAAVHALALAHCKYASDVLRKERRALCGTPLATTDTAAITAAKNLNSDRVALVHLGGYDFDTAGRYTLYPPYIVAAMVAGGFAGVNPGTAMTNKALPLKGLERKLRNPADTDQLILGGVMPIEDTPTGYRVVKSITTWLTNNNYNRVEFSVGVAVDYISRALREALRPLIGSRNGPQAMVAAKNRAIATLNELARPEPQGIGVIVGDAANPPWRNLRIEVAGDVLRVSVECSPVIPINYIPITISAVPYSGSLAA